MAGIERGQQHAALEDELLPVLAGGQASEEAHEDVEDDQFPGGAVPVAGQVLQVQVGVGPGRYSQDARDVIVCTAKDRPVAGS